MSTQALRRCGGWNGLSHDGRGVVRVHRSPGEGECSGVSLGAGHLSGGAGSPSGDRALTGGPVLSCSTPSPSSATPRGSSTTSKRQKRRRDSREWGTVGPRERVRAYWELWQRGGGWGCAVSCSGKTPTPNTSSAGTRWAIRMTGGPWAGPLPGRPRGDVAGCRFLSWSGTQGFKKGARPPKSRCFSHGFPALRGCAGHQGYISVLPVKKSEKGGAGVVYEDFVQIGGAQRMPGSFRGRQLGGVSEWAPERESWFRTRIPSSSPSPPRPKGRSKLRSGTEGRIHCSPERFFLGKRSSTWKKWRSSIPGAGQREIPGAPEVPRLPVRGQPRTSGQGADFCRVAAHETFLVKRVVRRDGVLLGILRNPRLRGMA